MSGRQGLVINMPQTEDSKKTEDRKEAIAKEIQQIDNKLTNPMIRSAGGCGFTQKEIAAMNTRKAELQKEYRSLPNKIIELDPIAVDKIVTFENSRFKIKFNHMNKQFEFYDGNQFLSSDISFPDETTAKIIVKKQSSDFHGEVVDYVHTLKVYTAENPNPMYPKEALTPHTIFPQGYRDPNTPLTLKDLPKIDAKDSTETKKTGISKASKFLHRGQ
jgi:hypothetical protein